MADEVYFLTEDDRDLLRQMYQLMRRVKPETGEPWSVELGNAPECYVALTPAGGIPALIPDREYSSGTGSGTDMGELNTPGSADCEIYRMITTGTTKNLQYAGFTRTVYNLLEVAIPGDRWIVILRDKWGEWFIPTLNGLDLGTC